MVCNLTVVFDIVKLIVACDVKGLLQLVDAVALYMVGYNLVLFMLGTIVGLTSGVALAIAVAFGTAIFMILIDLAQLGFNLDLYMEQRGIDSYEELTGYFLAQVAEDAVYNFLLVNFMKFAKKAKNKIPSKVSNGVNKLNDKIKDAANTVANKLDDMVNKGNNGAKKTLFSIDAEEYAFKAIKGSDKADSVVLGKYEKGSPASYDAVAKDMDAQYFSLDNWDELSSMYSSEEIWKINEKFLDIQTSSGREIYLSHNPAEFLGDGSYYSKEIQYLIDNGYQFVKEGDIWHAIR